MVLAVVMVSVRQMNADTINAELEPEFRYDYTAQAHRLRKDLLADSRYDRHIPPQSLRSVNYSRAGTDVALSLRVFKVHDVKAAEGTMRLKVWLRMNWDDTRLSWSPAQYGNITFTHFWVDPTPTASSSELWVPDLAPYNARTNIVNTLDPAMARVDYQGHVFLSRPGMLDVMCRFSGLVAFPYDNLTCGIEFGGWGWSGDRPCSKAHACSAYACTMHMHMHPTHMHDHESCLAGGHQGLVLDGKGFSIATQEATAGSSYQEYMIEDVLVSRTEYSYECCPSEPWPIVTYTITLSRATNFYVSDQRIMDHALDGDGSSSRGPLDRSCVGLSPLLVTLCCVK